MANQRRLLGALVLVLAMVLGLGGCGGSSTSNPTPVTTTLPPAPVRDLVTQGSFPGMDPKVLYFLPFSTTRTGTVDVILDWTFATDDVDIYLAQGNNPCTPALFNNRTCTFLAFSESTTAKPEKISASNVAAGALTMYVVNWGPAQEAVSYQIFLTHAAGASAPVIGTSATGTKKGSLLGAMPLR